MGGHVNATWTDEQSEMLTALLAQGKSYAQIAVDINERFNTTYSRNAMCGKGFRLKLRAPKKKTIERPKKPKPRRVYKLSFAKAKEIRELRKSGLKIKELATRFDVCENTITAVCSYIIYRTTATKAAFRQRAESIELRCAEIKPRHLALTDLEEGCCRYPFGNGPFTFCGHPQQRNSSYCPSHEDLCHGTAPKLTEAEKQRRRLIFMKEMGRIVASNLTEAVA